LQDTVRRLPFGALQAKAVFVMNKTTSFLAKAHTGLGVLLGFLAVVLFTVWFARAHHAIMPMSAVLTLTCFSFGWAYLSIWQVHRRCRKFGLNRSNYTQLLSGPPPEDPDELFIWQWTLQLCYAVLALVLFLVGLVFTY
jgi:hypothetical protein